MRVLIVSGGVPTEKYPLLGVFEFDQAKALMNLGHEVVFISIDLRSIRRWRKWGKTHYIREGIDIYNISFPLGAVPTIFLYKIGRWLISDIYKDIVHHNGIPDLIHAHFTIMGAIAVKLKNMYGIPLVVTEHSSSINRNILSKSDYFLGKIAYSCADRLLAVSNLLRLRIKQHFNIEAVVVHNIIDVDSIQYNPQDHKFFTFISVGNLIYRKGFDLLIQAFAGIKEENVVLKIVGEGECRKQLEEQIETLHLQNRVQLLGYKSRSEISDLLNQSDVFVLASRNETFGVVYIESMLAGLPVIATRCGGPEDFVTNANGMLVDTNDCESLQKAMLEMRQSITRYDKRTLSSNCFAKFSPTTIAKQLVSIYKQIIKTNL